LSENKDTELETYNDLFKLLEDTLEKKEVQKKRGLNNYNMVNVVRKSTHEVGMHSNIIYSLINPDSNHFQGDLFLNIFIKNIINPQLNLTTLEDFGKVYSVQAEELTEANRRIDFTIKSDKYLIGIEMKVNASDLHYQVSDYYRQLEIESKNNGNAQKVFILYLTKYGISASEISLKINPNNKKKTGFRKIEYVKNISFKTSILNWVLSCQKEVRNITNLNMSLESYKEIVEKITNQYKGNVMSIEDELFNNKKELKLALDLDKNMDKIKGKVLINFFDDLSTLLGDKVSNEDIVTLSNYGARFVSDKKCFDQIKKSKHKPNFFGKTFTLDNGKVLYIFVAVKSVCYGILDLSKIDADFGSTKISNEKFKTYILNLECASYIEDMLYSFVAEDNKFSDMLLQYISNNS